MEHQEIIESQNDSKNIAIIAYLTLIGLIIAFVMNNQNKNGFASFHIRQSLGLMLTSLVCSFVNFIPFIGWLLYIPLLIMLLIMWVSGLMNAINNKEQPIMLLGKKYMEWFKNL